MHIYIAGIGGTGLNPLANLALDFGYEVSGSDIEESRNTLAIASRGARVVIGQDGSQIHTVHKSKPIDWVVVTSALSDDHAEILFAKDAGIKVTKRDEFINHIIEKGNLHLIAVSGTHGKTTTTAMLVWAFKELDAPISYSIGTNVTFGTSAAYEKGSEYFIYEADEFDRNMLSFHPYITIIPSLDYDHPDTYPDAEDYRQAFREFANQSEHLFTFNRVSEYAGLAECETNLKLSNMDQLLTELHGEHNRANATLAINALQFALSVDTATLVDILDSFPGSERRLEQLSDHVFTDYAHHPEEIRASIQAMLELNEEVIVVYQPHQNIRQHQIFNEYKDCFEGATKVYWLPTYMSREDPELEIIKPKQFIEQLDDPLIAVATSMNPTLASNLRGHLKKGQDIVFLGAGDIDKWARDNLSKITK